MFVLAGTIDIHMPHNQSLKEKRMIIKSISEKIKKRFSCSVAEVGHQEKWQRSLLGIAVVSGELNYLEKTEELIIRLIEEQYPVDLVMVDFEVIKK